MKKLSLSQIGSRIQDHFNRSRIYGMLQDDSLASAKRDIWDELDSKTPKGRPRYTSYAKAWARGYYDALWQAQWVHLEFVYRSPEGVTYSTHKDSKLHRTTEELYAAGRGSELGKWECTHCWKESGKPYSPFKPL